MCAFAAAMARSQSSFVMLFLGCIFASRSAATTTSQTQIGNCLKAIALECPDYFYVKYVLYTRTTNGVPIFLSGESVNSTTFQASDPTKILIHGFNPLPNLPNVMAMKDAYLSMGSYNVLVLNWSPLALGSIACYPTVVANSQYVAACLKSLVDFLRTTLKVVDIHVVAISIGTHVASYAAHLMRPDYLLPRITGLDPAKPVSGYVYVATRLEPGDAVFVDVIHTNTLVSLQLRQNGHVDFYVNGGFMQPGCGSKYTYDGFFCNHLRAATLFTESITSPTGFWGWRCPGTKELLLGQCPPNPPEVLMGENVSHIVRGVISIRTATQPPYALGPWMTTNNIY